MPAAEVLDAIEPYERLYEPELDKLEIEEEYARDSQQSYNSFYDWEIDCD